MRSKIVVMEKTRTQEAWFGIPGIERTPQGRLFAVWFSGGEKEPAPENRVYLQISDDDGDTFSDPQIIVEMPGITRVYDPTLWLDPDGVLWLIFNQGNPDTAEHRIGAICCTDPDASTPKWTEPRVLGFEVGHCFRMNKPTVLSNGDWLMPVTWAAETTHGWFTQGNELQGVGISSDKGKTWQLYGDVKVPKWALESMIMERTDGTVIMYVRSDAGTIWQSVSRDNGRTWSPGEATEIVNPGSRFFIRKMPSGNWLLINTPRADARTTMYAYLSKDEGRTWSDGLLLDEREQVSYPDATITPDGTVYAVYDRERHGDTQVLMAVFNEDEIK